MNITRFFALLAAIAVGLSGLTGCQQEVMPELAEQVSTGQVEHTEYLSSQQVVAEVTPVIQDFLDAQYRYVTKQDKTPGWEKLVLSGSDDLKQRLDSELAYWDSFKSYYSEYTSRVDFSNAIISSGENGVWNLKRVRDDYSLTLIRDGEFLTKSTGGYPYEFSMQKINGKWKILDWNDDEEFLNPNGRWNMISRNKTDEDNHAKHRDRLRSKTRSTSGYDRDAAADYALEHYDNPSTNYPNYTNYGGDCTNFVSQCLEAGGWSQTSMSIPRGSAKAWYHKRGRGMPDVKYRSMSWTSAHALSKYLAQTYRVRQMSIPFSEFEKGDIVQDLTHSYGHSMIITDVSNRGVLVTYRSVNGFNGHNELIRDFGRFTFWKLADGILS